MTEPTSPQISAEIKKIVRQTYAQDPSLLTVNNVRRFTAENFDLEDDFFQSGDWKLRSKELVKQYMEELVAEEEEEKEEEKEEPAQPAPTKRKKRTSSASEKTAPRKRQKKQATPVDKNEAMDEVETEKSQSESIHNSSTKPKSKSKSPAIKAADESEMSDVQDEAPKPKQIRKTKSKSPAITAGDESEMSDVQDEAPKPKQVRRIKSEMAASKDQPKIKNSKSKSTTKSKAPVKSKSAPTDLSPEEAEIKTLQSHLVKCGIRKLWGVLLKPYGDDNKAKIKCLKEMLKEAGMTGRFSNERAAQIKEARELADEVEAVNEGAEKWGLEGGRKRLSRGKPSSKQRALGSDDEDDDEEMREKGSSSEPTDRKNADPFAFLGDEESD